MTAGRCNERSRFNVMGNSYEDGCARTCIRHTVRQPVKPEAHIICRYSMQNVPILQFVTSVSTIPSVAQLSTGHQWHNSVPATNTTTQYWPTMAQLSTGQQWHNSVPATNSTNSVPATNNTTQYQPPMAQLTTGHQ
jgi:hypothetical protein